MTELDRLIPPHEPAEDAWVFGAGLAIEQMIPVLGSIIAGTAKHAIDTRTARITHEFHVALVQALDELAGQVEDLPPLTDLLDTDEFVTTYNRLHRAATEARSSTKRARLAAALAAATIPGFTQASLETNLSAVERYNDMHVFLLAFYANPVGWLNANDLAGAAAPGIRGGQRTEPLDAALGGRIPNAARDALEDLQTDSMIGVFDLDEHVGDRKQFSSQTTPRGRRFLKFLREEPTTITPPA